MRRFHRRVGTIQQKGTGNRMINAAGKVIRMLDKQIKGDLSHMVNLFNRKKSAEKLARTRTEKTGTLDTEKIHRYRYDDEIFQTIEKVSDGNNHGLVIMIDTSASMDGANICGAVIQTKILMDFCRKVGIPFRVLGFANAYAPQSDIKTQTGREPNRGLICLSLREWFSSDMNKKQYDLMSKYIFAKQSCGHQRNSPERHLGNQFQDVPNSGTPLVDSIMALRQYTTDFIKKEKLQANLVTTIVLTDGDSHEFSNNVVVKCRNNRTSHTGYNGLAIEGTITDPKFKTRTKVRGGMNAENVLRHYKNICPGPLLGYFVGDYNAGYEFARITKNTTSNKETGFKSDELKKQWDDKGDSNIVSIDNYAGYDKFTAMDIKGLAIVTSYEEFTNEMRPAEPKRHWAWRHFFNTYAQEDGQEISIKKERKTMLTDFIEIIS